MKLVCIFLSINVSIIFTLIKGTYRDGREKNKDRLYFGTRQEIRNVNAREIMDCMRTIYLRYIIEPF